MLGRAVTHLMEFYAFIHLLVKGFAGRAVGGMKGCIVAIGTSASSYLSITIRAGEACIQHNFLKTLAVSLLEITDERIISFPVWESVFFKII